MIVQVFVAELSSATGMDIKPPWCSASALTEVASATPTSTDVPDTVEQMRDLKFQAAKVGFVQGCMVSQKDAKESEIWYVMEIGDDATIRQHRLPEEVAEPEIRKVKIDDLMSKWRPHKGKITQPLPGWSPAVAPHHSDAWTAEAVKGAISIAVRSQSIKYQDTAKHLKIFINPFMVMLAKGFKAGSLHIVAASPRVDKIAASDSIGLGNFDIGGEQKHYYLLKHFVPPIDSKGQLNKLPWVAPFWLVKQVDAQSDANMEIVFTKVQIHNITVQVPSMANKHDMKADTELSVLRWTDGGMPTTDGKEGGKRRRTSA